MEQYDIEVTARIVRQGELVPVVTTITVPANNADEACSEAPRVVQEQTLTWQCGDEEVELSPDEIHSTVGFAPLTEDDEEQDKPSLRDTVKPARPLRP